MVLPEMLPLAEIFKVPIAIIKKQRVKAVKIHKSIFLFIFFSSVSSMKNISNEKPMVNNLLEPCRQKAKTINFFNKKKGSLSARGCLGRLR